MPNKKSGLAAIIDMSPSEWVVVILTGMGSTAGIVAYAHGTFETKEMAYRRADRYDARFVRIEQLQIEMLKAQGVPIPPPLPPKHSEDSL